jgi:hypothetical protein
VRSSRAARSANASTPIVASISYGGALLVEVSDDGAGGADAARDEAGPGPRHGGPGRQAPTA